MSVWKPLLPAAMVGTERMSSWALQAPPSVAALLGELEAAQADPAQRLLRHAAVLATCSLAGAHPVQRVAERPPAAPPERVPALASSPWLLQLQWILRGGPERLQQQALQQLAEAGWRLPVALLPLALDLGRRSEALRPALAGVIGERGRWLAERYPYWRYAVAVSEEESEDTRWAHGSTEQRCELLRRQRLQAPDAARERMAAELGNLPAKERAELVATLSVGLSTADEPLLASLLKDRARDVRQLARGLLVRLPGSALVQRGIARLQPLLQPERGLLRQRWTLAAPEAADKAWDDDGIEPARPKHDPLGERAWWLYQLVRQVPLAWWCEHTGMAPHELLRWAGSTDWAEALLRGWRDVLLGAPEAAWSEALLEGWPWKGLADDPARILAQLPLAQRERHWQRQFADGKLALQALVPQLLAACPAGECLSAGLSVPLAQAVRKALGQPNIAYDYTLRAALPELCCVLHPDALPLLAEMPRSGDETPAHAEALHTMAQAIAARRAFDHLPHA